VTNTRTHQGNTESGKNKLKTSEVAQQKQEKEVNLDMSPTLLYDTGTFNQKV
jgi:hypothetical protein